MLDAYCTSGSSPTGGNEADFIVENHGSVFLLRPLTDSARIWVDEYIGPENGFQPYYPTVVVEHRYISHIVEGIRDYGLGVL